MEIKIDKKKENKILIITLTAIFVVFTILFILLTRDIEPEVVDERAPEEIIMDEQTEKLREEMEDFESLTEEDIEVQTQELDSLFDRMR